MSVLGDLTPISQAVVDGDVEGVVRLVTEAVQSDQEPQATLGALIAGVREVGNRFGSGEAFLPDLMLGAKAMKSGSAVLEPELARASAGEARESPGKVLLGTVKGDLHDIGKSLVALMLEINGYDVYDLGVDVSVDKFVAEAERIGADVIGMSSLLTTTAPYMRAAIEVVAEAGLRDNCDIIIGGAATSREFAEQIGADGWAENAPEAVELVENLMLSGRRRKSS